MGRNIMVLSGRKEPFTYVPEGKFAQILVAEFNEYLRAAQSSQSDMPSTGNEYHTQLTGSYSANVSAEEPVKSLPEIYAEAERILGL